MGSKKLFPIIQGHVSAPENLERRETDRSLDGIGFKLNSVRSTGKSPYAIGMVQIMTCDCHCCHPAMMVAMATVVLVLG